MITMATRAKLVEQTQLLWQQAIITVHLFIAMQMPDSKYSMATKILFLLKPPFYTDCSATKVRRADSGNSLKNKFKRQKLNKRSQESLRKRDQKSKKSNLANWQLIFVKQGPTPS